LKPAVVAAAVGMMAVVGAVVPPVEIRTVF
jgi:hypothetical protein